MQKQVILIMEQEYPFGSYDESSNKNCRAGAKTLVRKVHGTRSLQERN